MIRGWYHNFTQDNKYIFYDKRNILNGLRLETIVEQGRKSGTGLNMCPCEKKQYETCSFLQQYKNNLEKIDFNKMITDMQNFADNYKKDREIKEEIILILIVYEAPNNPCSERIPLQEYFTNHGWECKELEYPIDKLIINNKPFCF